MWCEHGLTVSGLASVRDSADSDNGWMTGMTVLTNATVDFTDHNLVFCFDHK